MIKNYFKLTFRNLWKTKGYSFLNISGLAIGILVASLIFLWIEDEVNFNNHFENKSEIYSVKNLQSFNGQTYVFSSSPGTLAPALKADFPEMKAVSRSSWSENLLFSLSEKKIFEKGFYVDPDFLQIFSVDFIEGQSLNSLQAPGQVVISESLAKKFFNRTNVVGEHIKVSAESELTISGVFKDLPQNVSVRFDWLRPYEVFFNQNTWLDHWGNNGIQTFVLLNKQADLAQINDKIYDYIRTKSGNTSFSSRLKLYNMDRWHLYNTFDSLGEEIEGGVKYVKLFSIIAWIVLLIACINFMNLSTARSQQRAKEIGIKKVVGAGRKSLVGQFIVESILLSFLACVMAVLLAFIALPFFNQLVHKSLELNLLNIEHLSFLLIIILGTGLVSGSYPALYLSSFEPISVLKGKHLRVGGANFIRRGLVVLQFAASITLIICSVLIYLQIKHASNKDVGYNKSGLITTTLYPQINNQYKALIQELKSQGLIEKAGRSEHHILNLGSNTSDYFWAGKDPNSEILITVDRADAEYFETLEIQLAKGRFFKEDLKADSNNVIINQTMASIMGISDDPIGKTISRSWADFTIVGVVEDFMITDVYSESEPIIFDPLTEDGIALTMRLNSHQNNSSLLTRIEEVFKQFNPEYPFEYHFIEDRFQNMFQTESLVGEISKVFAILAILISCLGLFGLASYTAERRTKEIGIRKVLGASTWGLSNMLSKEFAILVGVSCLIAFPLTYWMMSNWLDNYNYRIEIPWSVFLISGLLAFLVAMITVSSQAIKAALSNPVQAIKNE